MPRKRKLLNVRSHIEHVNSSINTMLEFEAMNMPGGIVLPPAFKDDLLEIRFIGEAILRTHLAKKTRKDIPLLIKSITITKSELLLLIKDLQDFWLNNEEFSKIQVIIEKLTALKDQL